MPYQETTIVFEPTETSAEAHELDNLTLDDAKGILHQLGYFSADTHFLSLRLTKQELDSVQHAAATSSLSLEAFLAKLCQEHVAAQLLGP